MKLKIQFLSLPSHISSAHCYRTFPLSQKALLDRTASLGTATEQSAGWQGPHTATGLQHVNTEDESQQLGIFIAIWHCSDIQVVTIFLVTYFLMEL